MHILVCGDTFASARILLQQLLPRDAKDEIYDGVTHRE